MTRDEKKMAARFAEAVLFFTKRNYCVGGCSEAEFRLATIDWVERWVKMQRDRVPEGTKCPYQR